MSLALRLQLVRDRMRCAAQRALRDPDSVRLVAVSKGQPAGAIREAYACGQRIFGENYVQELLGKAEQLADLSDLQWHMIGHLQSNKARKLAPFVAMVQSLDSLSVAQELSRRAVLAHRTIPVLLELNVGLEEAKTGAALHDAPCLIHAVRILPNLALQGLMTVPPFELDEAQVAPYFERLRQVRDEHAGRLPELSMGMSHDFETAIAHGATLVRVGTAIFGERAPRE